MKTPDNRSPIHKFAIASLPAFICLATPAAHTPSYPPKHFSDASGWGRNIQRTMRLLSGRLGNRFHLLPALRCVYRLKKWEPFLFLKWR